MDRAERSPRLLLATGLALALAPAPAAAATGARAVDAQAPQPAARGGLVVEAAEPLPAGQLALALFVLYAHDPLVAETADGPRPVIADQLGVALAVAGSPVGGLELSAALAVTPLSSGDLAPLGAPDEELTGGVSDLRLGARAALAPGLAALGAIALPAGDDDRFLGEAGPTLRLGLAAARPVVRATLSGHVRLVIREQARVAGLTVDDALEVALALAHPLGRAGHAARVAAFVELGATAPLRPEDSTQAPVELDAGLALPLPGEVTLLAGAGRGLTDGYGAPALRLFVGARIGR